MPRTAVPVQTVQNFTQGISSGFTAATWTAADATNDHSLDMTVTPLYLVVINLDASGHTFTIDYPANSSTVGEGATGTPDSVPAASGGVPGMQIIDMSNRRALNQGSNLAHIDFGVGEDTSVHLMAFTVQSTPGV